MVLLVRIQSDELFRGKSLLFELFDLRLKDNFWILSGVNTRSLDGNHENSSVLEEISAVKSNNSGLVRLGNISKNKVDHFDHESVQPGLSGILDDWNHIGSFLGHSDQISSTPGRELD